MVNEEFLNELLSKEDVSLEDKIKMIISEHEADTRGLVQKRDELLAKEVKLKEQVTSYEKLKADSDVETEKLRDELKKANPEAHKLYYETQLADEKAKFEAELKKVADDRDFYKKSHLKSLRDKAIENGIKELNIIPTLKDGFVARVLSMNEFEPETIDGSIKFLNKEHHTIEEAINAFALTQEGKAYIANYSSGGGAKGSSSVQSNGIKNPFKKESFNITEQMKLYKTDKARYDQLKKEAESQ